MNKTSAGTQNWIYLGTVTQKWEDTEERQGQTGREYITVTDDGKPTF